MLNYDYYKSLSKEMKKIAISFWVSEIMYRTGCITRDAIPIALAEIEGIPNNGIREQITKLWCKKYNGKLFLNDHQIRRVERLLVRSSYMLYHPLWSLLDKEDLCESDLINLALELPPKISCRIVGEKDGDYYLKEPRKSLALENSLDALTAMLILHISTNFYFKNRGMDNILENQSSVDIFKLFIRLFSMRHKFKYPGELYNRINLHFKKKSKTALPIKSVPTNEVIRDFPVGFGNQIQQERIELLLSTYRWVINLTARLFGLNNVKDKMNLFYYVSTRYLNDLINEIFTYQKTGLVKNSKLLKIYYFLYIKKIKAPHEDIQKLDYR